MIKGLAHTGLEKFFRNGSKAGIQAQHAARLRIQLAMLDEESAMRIHNPPHPGEVIREYLGEMTVSAAAKHLGVGRVTFSRVLNGKAAVSPEMAMRLAAAFGTSSPEVWLRLQAQYDLWQIGKRKKVRVNLLPRLQGVEQ